MPKNPESDIIFLSTLVGKLKVPPEFQKIQITSDSRTQSLHKKPWAKLKDVYYEAPLKRLKENWNFGS